MGISQKEWVELLKEEYFSDFIRSGGSAIRIVTIPESDSDSIIEAVDGAASEKQFLVARVNSADVRVDKIEMIFHEVAKQVDWDKITETWLRQKLAENGILVDDAVSLDDIQTIADKIYTDKSNALAQIRRIIQNTVFNDRKLSKDFRTAITVLCYGHVNRQDVSPTQADLIKMWLKGEKFSLTDLKKLQIYQRVARHNARPLIVSLARWLKGAGYSGLVVILEFHTVMKNLKPYEAPVRYTANNVKDCYEVLRQFIDDTDKSSNLMMIVVAGPELLSDAKRSLDIYDALKQRTYDDVKVKDYVNPLNMLVSIEAG